MNRLLYSALKACYVPVCVALSLRADLAKLQPFLIDGSGKPIAAQLTAPGLIPVTTGPTDAKGIPRELHFIGPSSG